MATRGWEHVTAAEAATMGKKAASVPQKRRSKYGAVKTTVDGIVFDSKAEAARWVVLRAMERAGKIVRLKRQHDFELVTLRTDIRGNVQEHECTGRVWVVGYYRADFTYDELLAAKTEFVVEDVKGFRTAMYRLKKKHFEAQYGITIREIR